MDFLPTTVNQIHTNHDWSMSVDSTNIRVKFGFEGLKTGIVPFLRLFGRELRYGTLNRKTFLDMYLHHYRSDLKQLTQINDHSDCDSQKRLAFFLYMVRISVQEPWIYPALISRDLTNRLDQATGMSRSFASLITKELPWEQYPVLLSEEIFRDTSMFEHCDIVTTDRQLHEVLNRDYNKTSEVKPKTNIDFIFKNQNNQPYLRLEYIGNGSYHDDTPVAAKLLLKKFIEWRDKFPKPTVKIWTAWPDLVTNTHNFWQIQLASIDQGLVDVCVNQPAYLESQVRRFHANHRNSMTTDYELWITKPKFFDLVNLLPWMNLDANVFHNNSFDFLLYRADANWVSEVVSVYSHRY